MNPKLPAVLALMCGTLFSAPALAPHPPRALDTTLRARVAEFYRLTVAHKYREAERLVAPGSKESYYRDEKPDIQDFKILKIDWDKDFHTATVQLSSTMKVRRAMVGQFDLNETYLSHWQYKAGQWLWFIPEMDIRQSAFGAMHVNPELAAKSGLDIHTAIAQGPNQARLPEPFNVDKQSVTLDGNQPQLVTITNLLPGRLGISFHVLSGSGFSAMLKTTALEKGESAVLQIEKESGKTIQGGQIQIVSSPVTKVVIVGVQ